MIKKPDREPAEGQHQPEDPAGGPLQGQDQPWHTDTTDRGPGKL